MATRPTVTPVELVTAETPGTPTSGEQEQGAVNGNAANPEVADYWMKYGSQWVRYLAELSPASNQIGDDGTAWSMYGSTLSLYGGSTSAARTWWELTDGRARLRNNQGTPVDKMDWQSGVGWVVADLFEVGDGITASGPDTSTQLHYAYDTRQQVRMGLGLHAGSYTQMGTSAGTPTGLPYYDVGVSSCYGIIGSTSGAVTTVYRQNLAARFPFNQTTTPTDEIVRFVSLTVETLTGDTDDSVTVTVYRASRNSAFSEVPILQVTTTNTTGSNETNFAGSALSDNNGGTPIDLLDTNDYWIEVRLTTDATGATNIAAVRTIDVVLDLSAPSSAG